MSPAPEEIRFCTTRDGVRLAYAISGSGPPLVWAQHWVHRLNLDWDSLVWRHWLQTLTRHHTVIRFDWRGCGLSDQDLVEFCIEKYTADLSAVIEAARVERFVLFGMAGIGSGIAAVYATRRPERISSLILYAPQTVGRLAGHPTSAERDEAEARLKLIELGWYCETPAYEKFFTTLHIPDGTADELRVYRQLLTATTTRENAVRLLRSFWTLDVRTVLPQVSCPTLVLHCRGDCVIPFSEGRSVAALVPGAIFVPLDSRNHVLLERESAWQDLVVAVGKFLATSLSLPSEKTRESLPNDLTVRERQVLELVARGLDNVAIGERLRISKRTARNYVSAILAKLGVKTRAQAIVRARNAGLGH